MTIPQILTSCKAALANSYQAQFKGLVLYGSMARHQAHSDSDIDLLVLLNQPVDYFRELRTIIELLYPIQLQSERLISAKPAAWDSYEAGDVPLYRNVKREGVLV